MARITVNEAGGIAILAGLDLVAVSELGRALIAESDDGYNVEVSSTSDNPKLFTSYAHHPHVVEVVNSRGLVSTAAGRYQFLFRTWAELKATLTLPDFGPRSQDFAAIELFRRQGAIAEFNAGNIEQAIMRCAPIWASFPGANYPGQHMNYMPQLVDVYKHFLSAAA